MGVEEIRRILVQKRFHKIGIEAGAVVIPQVLESVLDGSRYVVRHRAISEAETPLELGGRGVGKEEQHGSQRRNESRSLLKVREALPLHMDGRCEGEGSPAHEHRSNHTAGYRGQQMEVAALEGEATHLAFQHQPTDRRYRMGLGSQRDQLPVEPLIGRGFSRRRRPPSRAHLSQPC